jgi:hypothetical protein
MRLKRRFTDEERLATSRDGFGRDPALDGLESFADEFIRELYHSGYDGP